MTPAAEAEALRYPIEEFFGDVGWKELSNKFVKAAKGHTCNNCLEPIQYAERHRVVRGLLEGRMFMARFCDECCCALVRDWSEFEARWKEKKDA